jgi:hypothetical protein
MGSGETAPSLLPVHRRLLATLKEPLACWFDTPYGFQENAEILSQKTATFFQDSLGLSVRIASLRSSEVCEENRQAAYSVARGSNYLISGPGSPTYVLNHWKDSALPTLFLDKLRSVGNVLIFASATLCALGAHCLPVYEIYKVGQKPHWLDGLDLLGGLGFRAVILPHYNNTVGGNHDTRFCYMGERRLGFLESQLESDLWIWGVDEHTAVVLDLVGQSFEVHGKGGFTLRQGGRSLFYPSGSQGTLAQLKEPFSGAGTPIDTVGAGDSEPTITQGVITDLVRPHEEAFETAIRARDGHAAALHLLEIEQILEQWSSDTDVHHRQLARAGFRQLLLRLGEASSHGLRDPREVVTPLVESLLELRSLARVEGRYDLSDRVRASLERCGVEVRDTRTGATWALR